MGLLLEECFDVLRENEKARAPLDGLGVRVADDLRLLDEEDFAPMLKTLRKIDCSPGLYIGCKFSTAPGRRRG